MVTSRAAEHRLYSTGSVVVESQKQKRGRKDQMCLEIIAESFPGLGKGPNAHIHRGLIGHINVSMQKTFSNTHVLKL